jgi:hypothetical protein
MFKNINSRKDQILRIIYFASFKIEMFRTFTDLKLIH